MHILLFQLQNVSHQKNLDDSKKYGIIERKNERSELMDWNSLSNIFALVLAIWFFVCKDLLPNIKDYLYAYKKDGTPNKEMRVDIFKKIIISFICFPCDLIAVSAGYLVGRIILTSEVISTYSGEATLSELTVNLNLSHLLFWVTVLLVFPACSWVTRFLNFLYNKPKRTKLEKFAIVACSLLLYVLSVCLVVTYK